ncbi:hypothetical protein M427DRAFT_133985 [Gonapodya prolifera JEL478]|uniref:Uncharacterized protein n=1 Tax=Gonapodya prolifera (strain JEL478) TaxID=1344416 RepID=A0A139AIK5_GONPJ|nr:hypothetical protein M427DRAFT_133985 [Gonapodya prolifera JEL478]|eukprot:KXS16642.1 hypothetical protein M427DRAFT_133985 [Gonapodya prolifera JEL478]
MTLSFYKWGPNCDHSFVRQSVQLSPVRHVRLIGHLDHLWETYLHRVLVDSGKRISWEPDIPYIDYFNSGFQRAK